MCYRRRGPRNGHTQLSMDGSGVGVGSGYSPATRSIFSTGQAVHLRRHLVRHTERLKG